MIDNYEQAMELMKKLEENTPVPVRATSSLVKLMGKNGVRLTTEQTIYIDKVFYSGDEGGISAALKMTEKDKEIFVVSITHLMIDDDSPLAEEIKAYQDRRIKILKLDHLRELAKPPRPRKPARRRKK